MFPVITWEMLLTPDNGLYDIYALYFFAKKVTNHLVHIDGHWHLQSNLSQRRGYSVCTAKKGGEMLSITKSKVITIQILVYSFQVQLL